MIKSLCVGLVIATTIIAASLFVPVSALAQAKPAAQTCPVTIQGDLRFTNASAQPVSAIIFHAVRLNAVGEEVGPNPEEAKLLTAFHASPDDQVEQSYTSKKGLQPGEKAHMADNLKVYGRPMRGSEIVIYARAVKFADGTLWKDDGSHSCRWSF